MPLMPADDLVEILRRLDDAGIEAWLDGGWGVDALLGGQTRPHRDVDLVLRVADVPLMREVMAGEGFELVHGEPESNFVLRDPREREIDVHPVRFDEDGNGVYRKEDGDDWIYPAEGFTGRGTLLGREVKCLSPDVQMLGHAGGYVPKEKDYQDMGLLHEGFGTKLLPPYDRPQAELGSPE
jgi:lincosamide nucleotidyltransferase A/C/D/E